MALALPANSFIDVQRFLRQKRATGQTVSPTEERNAWAAYWDAMAARSGEAQRLGLEAKRVALSEEELNLAKERAKSEERAATVAGITQLGTTALLGGYVLKGTELGAKIGLGAAKTAAPKLAATTAAPVVGATTPGVTAAETAHEAAMASASTPEGVLSSISPFLGPAAGGFVAGGASKLIPIGKGKTTGAIKGAAVGAGVGAYMAAGTAMGGPVGLIIGGVTGFLAGGK